MITYIFHLLEYIRFEQGKWCGTDWWR